MTEARIQRARSIAAAGGVDAALAGGTLPRIADLALSEALVIGLVRLGVRTFVGIFGHGSTEVGEVLRVYQEAGVVRVFPVRHETAASHAATALRWVTGERAAVFTSIGPGALQALAGSLASASNGIGVWHLYGDETTEDEGPNMQQIPRPEQGLFARLAGTLGGAYSLHTPEALPTALRRGWNTVEHPWRAGPFYLLLPMNTQPRSGRVNLEELPGPVALRPGPAAGGPELAAALDALRSARRVLVKLGLGARTAGPEIAALLDLTRGVAVHTPLATGVLPASHPGNLGVGGSKGSIPGNWAMDHADLLVAVGTRFVCQSDSSRTGYPCVERVISVNPDPHAANHYGRNVALVGDAAAVLGQLVAGLRDAGHRAGADAEAWRAACLEQRTAWDLHVRARLERPCLRDPVWGREVLTQPAAISIGLDWARSLGAVSFFDAGDVQANGFQLARDEAPGRTITETGASYMGFAVSALLAGAMARTAFRGVAFTGDGSLTMNPQILIDGAAHGVRGTILLLDNRRMAAISSLQRAQYAAEFATWDHVPVDYVAWARAVRGVKGIFGGFGPDALRQALAEAADHDGLSLVHVPVYYGPDPLGGLGAFGRWNVGSWVAETERLRHEIGL